MHLFETRYSSKGSNMARTKGSSKRKGAPPRSRMSIVSPKRSSKRAKKKASNVINFNTADMIAFKEFMKTRGGGCSSASIFDASAQGSTQAGASAPEVDPEPPIVDADPKVTYTLMWSVEGKH